MSFTHKVVAITGGSKFAEKVILLVGNNEGWMNSLVYVLSQDRRLRIFVASNGLAVIKFLIHITPQLLIVEDRLSDMTGIQLYDYLCANRRQATVPIILLCANLEGMKGELAARQLIAFSKSFDPEKLMLTVETLLAAPPAE